MHHCHLQRDTLLLLTLQTFYRLRVVLLAVLSRCLPANEIGKYFFALSFAESFTLLASFCLGPVLMRRVAADPSKATTSFAPMLGLRLVSGPLYLGCVGCPHIYRGNMVDGGHRCPLYAPRKLLLFLHPLSCPAQGGL